MLPFAGGIEGSENGAFIMALVAAVLYLWRPDAASGIKWAAIKTVPVALFAYLAWRLNAPWLLIGGLALSALGDWCLAFQGEKAFLGGLSSFFLAHAAYIALFTLHSGPLLLTGGPWRIAIALALLVHASWMSGKLARSVPVALKLPVFAYVAVISLMGLAASAYGSLTVLCGALLFALSDTLLATGKFLITDSDPRRASIETGVWITYIAAQVLILFGFVL